MARIDSDAAGREEAALLFEIQRQERPTSRRVALEKVLARLETKHRARVELPGFRALCQENRACRGGHGELGSHDLNEMRAIRGNLGLVQAKMTFSVQRFQVHGSFPR